MKRTNLLQAILGLSMLISICSFATADVTVDKMFSDHMVLQQDLAVPIWGTAAPEEKVIVSFRDQKVEITADKDGKWMVKLNPLKVGNAGTLTVAGKNTVVFEDVLVGEVWIGSGQSNMAGGAGGYSRKDEVLAKLVENGPYPQLRLYLGGWKVATPDDIKRFSAILFSFGQPLQKSLNTPVGLFVGAVGGTPSGRWLSEQMFNADETCRKMAGVPEEQKAKYAEAIAKWEQAVKKAKEEGKRPPRKPRGPIRIGDLYESKIEWAVPYGIRGVLWDQGESGTAVPGIDQLTMMGALIKGWHNTWGQGPFPFLYVQKPSGGGCAWDSEGNPATRMANKFSAQPTKPNSPKSGAYRDLHIRIMQHPKTAIVTTSDLGSGIHPANKSGYGQRACDVALGFVYGKDVEYYGPLFDSHKPEGKDIRIKFTHVGKGLAFKHGDKLQGFEVSGKDGKWQWAEARIEKDTVVVSCTEVAEPVHVRYGWGQTHTWANLFNKDGLPALTFTTDRAK